GGRVDRAFVDAGAWLALANSKDAAHHAVRDAFDRFSGRLITSTFVFDETVTRCLYDRHHAAAVAIGDVLLAGDVAELLRVGPADELAAWRLFRARPDKTYTFTDCTSFALMRRLGVKRAVA